MKKMILIIAMLVTGLTINAQDMQVPSKVSSSLMKKYPEAMNVEWKRTGVNYTAEFSKDKMDYDVVFDTKGNWLSTATQSGGEVPMKVQKGLDNSEYKNWQVGKVQSTETAHETTYKVSIRKGVSMRELYFNEDGKIIRDKSKI